MRGLDTGYGLAPCPLRLVSQNILRRRLSRQFVSIASADLVRAPARNVGLNEILNDLVNPS